MGTITAGEIIAQCQEIAQDADGLIWTDAQALEWVNDAQRAVVNIRPDSSASRSAVQLSPGVRQTISGLRLLALHYNLGSNGTTIGAPIRLVDRGAKDDADPDWTTETAATAVNEYIFDDRNPTQFDVSPPVHASTPVYVELSQIVAPTDVAATTDTIDLDDIYSPAIIEWVLYRFFSRDSEETPNYARSLGCYQNFFNILGQKLRLDMMVSPKMRTYLEKGKQ